MLNIFYTRQFQKDYKLLQKRHYELDKLKGIIRQLVEEIPLSQKHRDHPLKGIYRSYRECHINPDWLLIYKIDGRDIFFARTGTHSDLFQ